MVEVALWLKLYAHHVDAWRACHEANMRASDRTSKQWRYTIKMKPAPGLDIVYLPKTLRAVIGTSKAHFMVLSR